MSQLSDQVPSGMVNNPVRERLLEAAAECFAEHGFADTSVRRITEAAGCNVAAVNYYFGSKERLYHALFSERFAELRDRRIGALERLMDRDGINLEQVLRTFADAFLEPLTKDARGRATMQLFMRDMMKSYLPKGMIIEEMIKPTSVAFLRALRKVYPHINDEHAQLCFHSLVAQLVHIVHSRKLFAFQDRPGLTSTDMPGVVDHIVRFTAAGIRTYTNAE